MSALRESPRPVDALPFVVGVLADFGASDRRGLPPLSERAFVEVDRHNIDAVLEDVSPQLRLRVENRLGEDGGEISVELWFERLSDFAAENVARRVEPLRDLLEVRGALLELVVRMRNRPGLAELVRELSEDDEALRRFQLDQALDAEGDGRGSEAGVLLSRYDDSARDESEKGQPIELRIVDEYAGSPSQRGSEAVRERAADVLRAAVREMLDPAFFSGRTVEQGLLWRIAVIDELISRQLDVVVRDPAFQRLEASWRGLDRLARECACVDDVRIRMFNVSARELQAARPTETSPERDPLHRAIFDRELGTWGGRPFSLLIADYEFRGSPQDVQMLRWLSQTATQARALLVTGASPEYLDLATFSELDTIGDLEGLLRSPSYEPVRRLRAMHEARQIVLVLPRVLLRSPNRPGAPDREFSHAEDFSEDDMLLWGSAAHVLAEVLVKVFSEHPFCGVAVRGPGSAGLLVDLPFCERDGRDGPQPIGPTDVDISDSRCRDLLRAGLTPLVRRRGAGTACFPGIATFEASTGETGDAAPREEIEHRLILERLCHHAAVEMRENQGRFASLGECVEDLDRRFDAELRRFEARNGFRCLLKGVRFRIATAGPDELELEVRAELRPVSMLGSPAICGETVRLPAVPSPGGGG